MSLQRRSPWHERSQRQSALIAFAVLVATAVHLIGCYSIATNQYPQVWGPKPEGLPDACPALNGTYSNVGEFSPNREWFVFPLPIPLGHPAVHDGRFYRGGADSFRIETNDSETVRITVLALEHVVEGWTLSRERGDFECEGGRLIYWAETAYLMNRGRFFAVTRSLAHASDGSLLMLDRVYWSPASFQYHNGWL